MDTILNISSPELQPQTITSNTNSIPELLSKQMNIELNNFHTYINFASIADILGYVGASSYLKKQADGELEHFEKFRKYMCDRNYLPMLFQLPQKSVDNYTLLDIMTQVYNLECNTTNELTGLKIAVKETNDYVTLDFLDWYMLEQIEEEDTTNTYMQRLKIAGDNSAAILDMDRELGNL